MKKIWLAIILLGCSSTAVRSQVEPPQLLVRATQCLAAKEFLPRSRATALNFGYIVDSSSYPHENVLYVVEFARPGRPKGWVFTILLTENNGRQVFNIQNNAKFVRSKDEPNGVDFSDPPLGGVWTQERITSAIRQILGRASYSIPAKNLVVAPPEIQCESYTDAISGADGRRPDSAH
jgi:hypothetical protein